MTNVLTSDFECTTSNIGNPFDVTNKAVCLAYKNNNYQTHCTFDTNLTELDFNEYGLFVFFNAKFDLHWYRRSGIDIRSWKVWCCQLAEFLLSGQIERYPSLENTAIKYGLGHKEDVVKEQYWTNGIDTDAIPQDILSSYAKQDVDLTYQVYLKQLEQFKQQPQLYKLFRLQCQDLLVLQEMELNGLKYNPELCASRSEECNKEITSILHQLSNVYPDIPINFGSGDQLSSFLYGGTIKEEIKEECGVFKTGIKKGQVKYKNVLVEHALPRLITPLKGSNLAKEGFYKTDESTLRQLKGNAAKKFVGPLLRLAELQKLDGTYYKGLHEKNLEMNWPSGMIHGQFNQVVAATGRLSSSSPNLQNFSGDCQDIFVSRYGY